MQKYWNIITSQHQEKLLSVAQRRGLNSNQAMERLLKYIRSDPLNSNNPEYLEELATVSHIERVIDTIVG